MCVQDHRNHRVRMSIDEIFERVGVKVGGELFPARHVIRVPCRVCNGKLCFFPPNCEPLLRRNPSHAHIYSGPCRAYW